MKAGLRGSKRRTKMRLTPLNRWRQWNPKLTTEGLARYFESSTSKKRREIGKQLRGQKPKIIDGFKVYFVDSDRGILLGRTMVLQKKVFGKIPRKFLKYALRHEYREWLLGAAGYRAKPKKGLKTGHKIALRKELRDLQRAGQLKEYLQMLKTRLPEQFEDRVKEWNIDRKTLEPKDKE